MKNQRLENEYRCSSIHTVINVKAGLRRIDSALKKENVTNRLYQAKGNGHGIYTFSATLHNML